MNNDILNDFVFNVGWKSNRKININNSEYAIVIHLQAYYETEGITAEQRNTYSEYLKNEELILKRIEKLINDSCSDTVSSLTPSTLYIDRDGSLALLFDDANDPDEGIAVCLSPKEKILSQDEFL